MLNVDIDIGVVSMAHRTGHEHTSTMLDWVEPKGKAALVLATPLNIFRSGPGQKRIADAQ